MLTLCPSLRALRGGRARTKVEMHKRCESRRNMTIGSRIAGGFVIALVFVSIVGILAYRNTNRLVDTNAWVVHTQKVLEGLETILSLMKDEETGQRGFLVTGEVKFLKPYEDAARDLVPVAGGAPRNGWRN